MTGSIATLPSADLAASPTTANGVDTPMAVSEVTSLAESGNWRCSSYLPSATNICRGHEHLASERYSKAMTRALGQLQESSLVVASVQVVRCLGAEGSGRS